MTPAAHFSRSKISLDRIVKSSGAQGPTLATIQMVESAIKEAKEYPSKYQLWRSLQKGMHYQTLDTILRYLEASNKIMVDKDGAIIWIFADNPKLKKLLAESSRLR
ncbi:MAG: hypothetical protein ACREBU_03900 [Nitrososphaera sp.]